jgi:hypothetical protein
MRKKHLIIFSVTICITYMICFIGCKKSDSNTTINTNTEKITIAVVNETNQPVVAATLTCGAKTAITNSSGIATLEGVIESEGKYKVRAEAANYFMGYLNISKADGTEQMGTIKLLQKQTLGTIGSNVATTLTGSGFKLITTGVGFTDSAGNNVTGNITVAGRYISASNTDLISETMPGGDFAAIDAGNSGTLVSYGFTAFEFKNAAGVKVVPKSGAAQAAITVSPANAQQILAGGAAYWVFNDQSRTWVNAGAISIVANEVYMPVSISTFGNCDKMSSTATVKGKFTCNAVPKSTKVTLISRSSSSYGATYTTSSNANGNFKLNVAIGTTGTTYNLNAGTFDTVINIMPNTTIDIGTQDACRTGFGQFTMGAITYSGSCLSVADVGAGGALGYIDVLINGNGGSFIIYNMPQANSGTFSFTDGGNNAGSSQLYALNTVNSSLASQAGGSVIKTGAKKFSFNCTLYNIGNGQTSTVVGNGTY